MRRSLVIIAVVLLAIGGPAAIVGYVQGTGTRQAVIPAGSAFAISPRGVSGGTFSASWSNAPAGTHVYIVDTNSSCFSPSGIVAESTGASGTVSASLSIGTTYYVFACVASSPTTISMSYTYFGLSYTLVLGMALTVIGILLLKAGVRLNPPAPPAEPTKASAAASPPK